MALGAEEKMQALSRADAAANAAADAAAFKSNHDVCQATKPLRRARIERRIFRRGKKDAVTENDRRIQLE